MRKEFAFCVDGPKEINYFAPVIKNLPPDLVDILLMNYGRPLDQEGLEKISSWGYSASFLEHDKIGKYHSVAISSMLLNPDWTEFDFSRTRKPNLIALFHATDLLGCAQKMAANSYILANQRQAEMPEPGKTTPASDPSLFAKLMELPREMTNQFAFSGPYHLGEWDQKRHTPKEALKEELEGVMGIKFPAGKPLVLFMEDEFLHAGQAVPALEALAKNVNLVVKPTRLGAIPGAFLWQDPSYAPNLLRFAADFILCGYHSGTLSTATMLGLRAIPYYTPLIHWDGKRNKFSSHLAYMPGYFPGKHICVDIIKDFNKPLNLMETESILDRITDENYWQEYQKRLPLAQKNIFGDYVIDNAAEKTAKLILQIFNRNSFGKDTAAIGLRAEYITSLI